MDLERLGKKLRNELLRNPKKSAVLGVVCLVALYFWFPLARGWLFGSAKKSSNQVAKTQVVAAPPTVSPTSSAVAPLTHFEPGLRWHELMKLRAQDPFMSPAMLSAPIRSPFELSDDARRELAAAERAKEVASTPPTLPKPQIAQTPEQLGLVLTGVFVGRHARAATIGGRTYSEGSMVVLGNAANSDETSATAETEAAFKLSEVSSDHVILVRGDDRYELKFHSPELPPGDEIVRGKRKQ